MYSPAFNRVVAPSLFTINPILNQIGMQPSTFAELVTGFGKLFHNVAGNPTAIDQHRSPSTHRRFRTSATAGQLLA